MNKYYRVVTSNGKESAVFDFNYDIIMGYLAVPYYVHLNIIGKRYHHYKRMKRYYYWFTEEWYNSYILKCIKENQVLNTTVAILTTNTEPAFLDGQQACFKYCGSEHIKNIQLTTIKCYLTLEVHKI